MGRSTTRVWSSTGRLGVGARRALHQVKNTTAGSSTEATTSKVDEDQLFYQRGIGEEEAVALVVNGFCREVSLV